MDCPYLNQDRPECCQRLNMQHLDDAYELCVDKYMFCPVYLQLSRKRGHLAGVGASVREREIF
jgi:hypothetical protein